MFETTEPVIEPRTTSGSPFETASRAMISSGALPKLALRKPPMPGPVCSPACSVASPISHASGISAVAASTNSSRVARRRTANRATSDDRREARASPRGSAAPPAVAYRRCCEAVLFDWGDTLMQWTCDPELLVAGHRAGLAAIGRDDDPRSRRGSARRTCRCSSRRARSRRSSTPASSARCSRGRHRRDRRRARPLPRCRARRLGPGAAARATTHALLDALRADGLRSGLVSNAFDPPRLLHRDLEELGVAERLDAAVFSSEVGRRKPDPAIFLRALELLGVGPSEALFVGDRLYEDVRGAAALGMTTVQALWFRADEHPDGGEPDFQAFTQMDVLNVARRPRER